MGKSKKSIELGHDIEAYNYNLPEKNIAQTPATSRDRSRLLVLDCRSDTIKDLYFSDITKFLKPRDLLVINDTKVFPARIIGKKETGGQVELFLLEYPNSFQSLPDTSRTCQHRPPLGPRWSQARAVALIKSSKRPRPGIKLLFGNKLEGRIEKFLPDGKVQVMLSFQGRIEEVLSAYGKVPLPPYIRREHSEFLWDGDRYQTLFARRTGAVAAPTAGLHFSNTLIDKIKEKKVSIAAITLHVGYGTFAPVRVADIRQHNIHEEYVVVSKETAQLANETRKEGGRIWAVGTTTVRSLEFAADTRGRLHKTEGWCNLYIYPGYRFKAVNSLITNFHLPRSSLLFLVAALAGRERTLRSYKLAIDLHYRFYSYGDAMAIIT